MRMVFQSLRETDGGASTSGEGVGETAEVRDIISITGSVCAYYNCDDPISRLAVSEITLGMQRKENLSEGAELTPLSMNIPS